MSNMIKCTSQEDSSAETSPPVAREESAVASNDGQMVIDRLKQLLQRTRAFNTHFSVFKKILNLREPSSDFVHVSNQIHLCNNDLSACESLDDLLATFEYELNVSHILGTCLAYNVQDLHKKLNGIPIDTTATDGIVQGLTAKFKSSRDSESELRFEFEEKRKLLRRLRQQLEQARRDWNNLKVRVQEPDSAIHSSDSESISDDRSQRLTRLEEQANQLVTRMRRPFVESTSLETADTDDDVVLEEEEEEEDESETNNLIRQRVSESVSIDQDLPEADEDEDERGVEGEEEEEEDQEEEEDDEEVDRERAVSSQLTIVTPEVEPIESEVEEEEDEEVDEEEEDEEEDRSPEPRELMRNESIAETGEPAVLCRLRRKAVEVLVSRLKEERGFHETRERELKVRLDQLKKCKKQSDTLCVIGWTVALFATGITVWTLI